MKRGGKIAESKRMWEREKKEQEKEGGKKARHSGWLRCGSVVSVTGGGRRSGWKKEPAPPLLALRPPQAPLVREVRFQEWPPEGTLTFPTGLAAAQAQLTR